MYFDLITVKKRFCISKVDSGTSLHFNFFYLVKQEGHGGNVRAQFLQ